MADIIDFFMIGDGEDVLPQVCKTHAQWKESAKDKDEFLKSLTKIDGIYVPKFYNP